MNGSAASGSDYDPAGGTLVFAPGETSKQIVVQVNGDTTVEPDEKFSVNLSNATGATIRDAIGVRLVPRVDDRAVVGRRARDLLIDVLRALTDAVVHSVLGLEDLAGAGVDLARHQERDQLLGEVIEIDVAID